MCLDWLCDWTSLNRSGKVWDIDFRVIIYKYYYFFRLQARNYWLEFQPLPYKSLLQQSLEYQMFLYIISIIVIKRVKYKMLVIECNPKTNEIRFVNNSSCLFLDWQYAHFYFFGLVWWPYTAHDISWSCRD